MIATATPQITNRLPDGRRIRPLEVTKWSVRRGFSLRETFRLLQSGLYDPKVESIMGTKDFDAAFKSGAYRSIMPEGRSWAIDGYVFYPKGFESNARPMGEDITFFEGIDGQMRHTFKVPAAQVEVRGQMVDLRDAVGVMGIIPIAKLQIENIRDVAFVISVNSQFDPKTDVTVVEALPINPNDDPVHEKNEFWALVDKRGYPLRSEPADANNQDARCLRIRRPNGIGGRERATGWHGRMTRTYTTTGIASRVIGVHVGPFDSLGVAVVSNE